MIPQKILAVKLADVGDVLTATPALRALRQTFPSAHIAALVPANSAPVFEGSALVDEVLVFNKSRFDRYEQVLRPTSLAYAAGFLVGLRRRAFDTVLLFHHLTTQWGANKYAILLLASGAATRVGLDNGRGWFLTHRAVDEGFGAKHEVEYCLDMVGLLGATTEDRRLDLPLSRSVERFAQQALSKRDGRPWVALHPGSGAYSVARRWPAERFITVGKALAEGTKAKLVVVGGPEERELAAQVAEGIGGQTINLAGQTTLKQLAALLKRCDLFIGNDSGVMHLAAAVGTPTVVIFGPSNWRAWGPWSPSVDGRSPFTEVLHTALACQPCFYVGTSLGTPEGCPPRTCLELISPSRVLDAAQRLLVARGR